MGANKQTTKQHKLDWLITPFPFPINAHNWERPSTDNDTSLTHLPISVQFQLWLIFYLASIYPFIQVFLLFHLTIPFFFFHRCFLSLLFFFSLRNFPSPLSLIMHHPLIFVFLLISLPTFHCQSSKRFTYPFSLEFDIFLFLIFR